MCCSGVPAPAGRMRHEESEKLDAVGLYLSAAEIDRVVEKADCIVFDFHLTLCSDLFFTPLGESVMADIKRLFWEQDQMLQSRWMTGQVNPRMKKGLKALMELKLEKTYTVSFRIITLAQMYRTTKDKRLKSALRGAIKRDVDFLVDTQFDVGARPGRPWPSRSGRPDS